MILALPLGLLIGFITAIPVAGPISAIVFSYGMQSKFTQGRWLAAGAGLVEGFYAFIAFLGFHYFLEKLPLLTDIANLVTALILIVLGTYFYRSKKMRIQQEAKEVSSLKNLEALVLGAGISGTNFTLLATWSALVASLHSLDVFTFTYSNFLLFSAGVAVGIYLWFAVLLMLIDMYGHQFQSSILDKVLKGIGCLLWVVSASLLWRLPKPFFA